MNKLLTAKGICLLVSSLALAGLTACSDQNPADTNAAQTEAPQPEATQLDTPEIVQQEENPVIEYSPEASGAELAFQNLDADQDQLISMAEAEGNLGISSEFGIIDLDQDGAISMDEFMVYAGEATAAGTEEVMPEESNTQ